MVDGVTGKTWLFLEQRQTKIIITDLGAGKKPEKLKKKLSK